jgi:hypothetical protein
MPDHRQARGDGRREKDRNFVAALVRSSLVDRDTIHSRLATVDERYRLAVEATSWLRSL